MKRRDLALEYFPGKKPVEAVRNLRRWINNCPKLKEELLPSTRISSGCVISP